MKFINSFLSYFYRSTESVILLFVYVVAFGHGFVQELTLYQHEEVTGQVNRLSFVENVADINKNSGTFKLADVKRVCARGIWFAYPLENYRGKYRPFGSSTSAGITCTTTPFTYRSFRHLGASQVDESAVSLYVHPENSTDKWSGDEILVNQTGFTFPALSTNEKNPSIQYFSITGPSDWLFFEEPEFRGKSTCFENYHLLNAWSVADSLNLTTVGSVFKSCNLDALEKYKSKAQGTSRNRSQTEL